MGSFKFNFPISGYIYAPRLSDHIRLVTSNRTNLRYFVMLLSPIQCYLIHPTLQT